MVAEEERPNNDDGYKVGRGHPPREHCWKPGQSGNPGGRPKGTGVMGALRKLLEKEHNGRTIAEILADRWMKDALEGRFPQLKELLDRTEGRPPERHEIEARQPSLNDLLTGPGALSDEAMIALYVRSGRPDLMSARLRELAQKQETEGSDAPPEAAGTDPGAA